MNADTEVFTNPPIRRVVVTVQGYLQNNLNNLKTKKTKIWGFAPNPTLTRPQGQVAKPTHLPLRRVLGRFQGIKGKMHGFAALDPFPSP